VRLSLRYKIVGGFLLLLALIGLLGWVTLSLFTSLRTVQRRVFDDAVPGLVAADEIVRSYTAQSAAVSAYVISSKPYLLQQYRTEARRARTWERRGESLFTTRREKSLVGDLIRAGRRWRTIVDTEVLPLAEAGQRTLAFSFLGNRGNAAITRIESLGVQLRDTQDGVMSRAQRSLQDRSTQALVILVVVTIGALVVGVVLAIVLPRRLVSDLGRLVDAARAIGRGDLDQSLVIKSGDEVEELAERFDEMQSGLKRLQQLALHDRELEIAASIQRNLLQRTLPATPGVSLYPVQRQANLVGGDWYDVESAGETVTVVVGDASGKGIGAALLATVALSVLRAERGLGASAKRIIERANEALIDATDPDSFTTCIFADLDTESGRLRWLNMGHPPPFFLRRNGEEGARGQYLEGPRNRVLGWFENPGLEETEAVLEPGDRVILYTDGFLEAKSPDGETFGEHRFSEATVRLAGLGGQALAEELIREVERFAAGKLDDDLTMLVVEFQGVPVAEHVTGKVTGEEPWHSRR
jgi:serine phosphatase RsbU (regulator of sigma subunit)/CHASE3 domain sensor protein